MKCQYCGGDISLEDRICPHCGRLQENAVRHDEEMKRYEAAFEDTRNEVLARSSQSARGIGVRLLVILVLLGGAIYLFAHSSSWSVRSARREREANANVALFTERIEQYLEERDYEGLNSFSDYYMLTYNDNYKKYYTILWACDRYANVCESLMAFVYLDPQKKAAGELDYRAKQLPEYISLYFEATNPEDYSWNTRIDKELTEEVIAAMDEDLAGLLTAHLGIPAEQARTMRELSEGRRTVLIEEAEDARIQEQRETQ